MAKCLFGTSSVIEKAGLLPYFLFLAQTTIKFVLITGNK